MYCGLAVIGGNSRLSGVWCLKVLKNIAILVISSGSRITVEASREAPRGSGRCFNCGLDGHWDRDCAERDWKNQCDRCGLQKQS
ncbi:hypothetical protein Bca4012_031786 [Brassica carinata]|uniref:CCHC-type domain-containing protein n=1 Tax=Brassica carinata TaxID=52824 RepID=A0A8X7RFS2_BRACI|nr:hypothetical protein Bca52824_046626 [Brassica carinata]